MSNLYTLSLTFYLSLATCVLPAQTSLLPGSVPFARIEPRLVTDTTRWDTDDPAIWINPKNPSESLIIGTDKNRDGALYAFDLKGKIKKRVGNLNVPNNVDIAYGFPLNGKKIDIAVVTERLEQRIRVFQLPEMTPLDHGDLYVFNREPKRSPMGIALYKRPSDQSFFVFVGGKSGPTEGYIGQYRLEDNRKGHIKITEVRQFGKYSGKREIESIAVDAELGYIYYSDEQVGVRKYHADPDKAGADKELALFATKGFREDHEGISIYKTDDQTGYILVSDQQANQFHIFTREGSPQNAHDHRLVKIIKVSARESDGSDITSLPLSGDFKHGLFVTMSEGKVFHYYAWEDIAGTDLKTRTPRDKKDKPGTGSLKR